MTCYVGADTKFSLSDTTLCGEPVNGDSACCIGSDSCMENFICHFTHTQANMSGYYVQGCTDSTHLSDACSSQCSVPDSQPFRGTSDVVFVPATNLWACCADAGVGGCGIPTDETFQAPPPEDLKTHSTTATSSSTSTWSSFAVIVSTADTWAPLVTTTQSSSSSTTNSSTAVIVSTAGISAPLVTTTLIPSSSTTNVTQANLPTPNTSRWSGFSGGATAGITVGAVVGVLALLALAFFLFRSPRRRTTDPGHRVKREPVSDPRAYTGSMQELGADYNIELDSTIRVELDSRTRAELELGRGVKVPFKGYRGKSAIGGVEF